MNQALINELRAHANRCQVAMHRIEESWENGSSRKDEWRLEMVQLVAAKAHCLHGIAVLVAARGK